MVDWYEPNEVVCFRQVRSSYKFVAYKLKRLWWWKTRPPQFIVIWHMNIHFRIFILILPGTFIKIENFLLILYSISFFWCLLSKLFYPAMLFHHNVASTVYGAIIIFHIRLDLPWCACDDGSTVISNVNKKRKSRSPIYKQTNTILI